MDKTTVMLNLYGEKEWLMIDPTLRSLEALVAFDSVEKAISGVRAVEHVIPWTEDLDGKVCSRILRDRLCRVEAMKKIEELNWECKDRVPRC